MEEIAFHYFMNLYHPREGEWSDEESARQIAAYLWDTPVDLQDIEPLVQSLWEDPSGEGLPER